MLMYKLDEIILIITLCNVDTIKRTLKMLNFNKAVITVDLM